MTGHTKLLFFPLAFALLLLPGCALSRFGSGGSTDQLPKEEFRGHFTVANGSWFTPCKGQPTDRWWVTAMGPAVAQVDSATRDGRLTGETLVYVHWLAAKTMDGKVGPRGPGKPALLVSNIRVLRPVQTDDCL